eukprot:TRINITY_DN8890_c0_g1_i1.p1 TRINITY_DN8890_c0_g1~~TRINITY_DN8890_c0_g1_i1.p1  ORF type:complete len:131 (+),score=18.40 TRINITY_DN8890_c0_g1_i1:89-481(+)
MMKVTFFVLLGLVLVFSQNCDRDCIQIIQDSNNPESTFQSILTAIKSLRSYTVRSQNPTDRFVDGAAFDNNLYYGWEFHVRLNRDNVTEINAAAEEQEGRCVDLGAKTVITNVMSQVAGVTNTTTIRGCR